LKTSLPSFPTRRSSDLKAHPLEIAKHHKTANERHGKKARRQGQAFFDESAGGVAEPPQQHGHEKEPQAARDDRGADKGPEVEMRDRKSTRLNSSHRTIS